MEAKSTRIFGLDSLRAWLMLLGVFSHGSYFIYSFVNQTPLDRVVTFFIFQLVHSFRMELFFIISGFLTLLYFKKKGFRQTIKNRFTRIVIPFVGAMVFLMPFKKYACNVYASVTKGSSISLSIKNNFQLQSMLPQTSDYLWFLVYLTWFVSCILLLLYIKSKFSIGHIKILQSFHRVATSLPKRILFFTCLTLLLSLLTKSHDYYPSLSLLPDLKTFTLFFAYFIFGVLLYKSQLSLQLFSAHWGPQIIIGMLLLVAKRFLLSSFFEVTTVYIALAVAVITIVATQLFVFGFLGMFIKYFNKASDMSKYFSNASYWVYLIHMLILPVVPLLLLSFHLPQVVVYFINVFATFCISLLTYHFFVRSTFIGYLLNGRVLPSTIAEQPKSKNIDEKTGQDKYSSVLSG